MDSLLLAVLNNSAWAAALALLVAVVARLRPHRPALVHALWALVLIKLLTPSIVRIDLPTEAPFRLAVVQEGPAPSVPPEASRADSPDHPLPVPVSNASDTLPPVSPEKPATIVEQGYPVWAWPWSFQQTLIGCWIAGSAAWCLLVTLGIWRLHRLIRSSRPAPDELNDRLNNIAARMDLRRIPATYLVPARIPPMLWALIGAPRLILPQGLWSQLGDDERDAILAHELAHLKRRDEWTRRLEAVVLSLYWWNPVAWWARREIEHHEEECCDAWVLWTQPSLATAYARALVQTADFLSESHFRPLRPVGASGAGHLPPLKRRLSMILNHPTESASPKPWLVPRLPLIVAGLGLLALPAWALSEPPKAAPAPSAPTTSNAKEFHVELIELKDDVTAKEEPKPAPAAKPPVLDAPPEIARQVTFTQVVAEEVRTFHLLTGVLQPATPVDIRSHWVGTVEVLVPHGNTIKKGDALFEITTPVQGDASTANQEAARGIAKRQHKRRIASPMKGIFYPNTMLGRDQREVRVNDPLGTVVPVNSMQVVFHISQPTFITMRRKKLATGEPSPLDLGSPVEVEVDGDEKPLDGQIVSVDGNFKPASQTLACRANFANPDDIYIPGMSAKVKFFTGESNELLLIPTEALPPPAFKTSGGITTTVVVVNEQDTLEHRQVFIEGSNRQGKRVVRKGLKKGDWVITGGRNLIPDDGIKVKRSN